MIIYNSQNLKGTIYSIFSNIFGSYTDNVIHVERTVLAAKDFLSKLPSNTDKIQEIVDYNYNHWLKRAKTEYDDTTNIFMSFINSV
jgi:hypothetical protein